MSFFNKAFLTIFIGTTICFAIVMLYSRSAFDENILHEVQVQALREVNLVAALYDNLPMEEASKIVAANVKNIRVSLYNNEGDLLSDSYLSAANISPTNNYAYRPEIQKARQDGQGIDVRYSNFTKCSTVFASVRLKNNDVVRVAIPTCNYLPYAQNQGMIFILIAILAILFAGSLAMLFSNKLKSNLKQLIQMIDAIAKGQYHLRLYNLSIKEFRPLGGKINHMNMQVEESFRTMAEQKEQLQHILDTMNEGVLVLGSKGGIKRCNAALRQMFPGIETAEGLQIMEVIPAPTLQKAIENILKNDNNVQSPLKPLHLELSAGRIFSVQLTKVSSNELNLGAVLVFHDITALMRLERVRSDFVANVSHELRTPLTAIQGYAETLTELDNMPENSRRFAEIIRKNGAYLARMVEELLSLARIENADVPMQVSAVQPLECINIALALCRRQLDLDSVSITIDVPENLNVMASAQNLTQVFRNLLENAGRYAPAHGQVHIKALQDKSEKSMTLFAVCDTGPGIPAPDQDRIFERFYRVEKHRSHASTGLGLAICKHTVERLGGRIWVESPTKEYSTVFYFTIPTALGDAK